jgi:hypothetical protein
MRKKATEKEKKNVELITQNEGFIGDGIHQSNEIVQHSIVVDVWR